jgi:5'-phosphate synthase pdxT subunit
MSRCEYKLLPKGFPILVLTKPTVGIIALQGDFSAHGKAFSRAGAAVTLVRTPDDLKGVQALAMPGGESTTMTLLGYGNGLWQAVKELAQAGMPVFATCAGVIMLATELAGENERVKPLGLLDITVSRNAYGSQVDSFEHQVRIKLAGNELDIPGVFIRAPLISGVRPPVEPCGWIDGQIVMVRQGAIWGMTFHPELSGNLTLQKAFLEYLH